MLDFVRRIREIFETFEARMEKFQSEQMENFQSEQDADADDDDDTDEVDMIEEEGCTFIVKWTGIGLNQVGSSVSPNWETTARTGEVRLDRLKSAIRFYNALSTRFSPELWLEVDDDTRILMRSETI